MTIDPKDINVDWSEHRRIKSDGSVVEWDRETMQWVPVSDEPPTWDELRRHCEPK